MIIHTMIYKNSDITNDQKYISKIIFWNNEKILNLLNTKYPIFYILYKKLKLNRSRENLIKYILLNEIHSNKTTELTNFQCLYNI